MGEIWGIYEGDDSIYAFFLAYSGWMLSRYVLDKDSTFRLQFSTERHGTFEYLGTYARVGTLIAFKFDGWSTAGPWKAIGTLHGDSLSVRYNDIMMMSDFIDGLYVRPPTSP